MLIQLVNSPESGNPIGQFFIENTIPLAGGNNAVNTILVDFRGFDTTLLFAATDSVNRFFSNNNSLLNFGSSIGMKVIDNIPYIKRLLMYEAMGVNGDLPKLLRGFVP